MRDWAYCNAFVGEGDGFTSIAMAGQQRPMHAFDTQRAG